MVNTGTVDRDFTAHVWIKENIFKDNPGKYWMVGKM
jgi:hypothetical protein